MMALCPTTTQPRSRSRRRFSAAYKLAILDEYEQATDPGAKGALLRREGLYSSHIVEWRRARELGALGDESPAPRRSRRSADRAEIERLKRKNERLESQLAKHRQALEIQGKASEALVAAAGRGHRGDDPAARAAAAVSEACFAAIEPLLGTRTACAAVGRARATHYRRRSPGRVTSAPTASGAAEQAHRRGGRGGALGAALGALRRLLACAGVLHPLGRGHLPRLGVHLLPAAARTRRGARATAPRRRIRRRRSQSSSPTAPDICWSWDITKLHGPRRGEYFDCYAVLGHLQPLRRRLVRRPVSPASSRRSSSPMPFAAIVSRPASSRSTPIAAHR